MCNDDKNAMFREIMALNFAINDLTLYLDTHPTDEQAIKIHNEYSQKVKALGEQYQSLYGPLTIDCVSNTTNWQWADCPWPWERS